MLKTTAAAHAITGAVAKLYEAFPYPFYPLLAKPRWQDGYLASSLFARRLAQDLAGAVSHMPHNSRKEKLTVLVAGCGEILPYIIRRWEPAHHDMTCLDLSASSLRRARLRLWRSIRPPHFIRSDLDTWIKAYSRSFAHIDAYGLLHHLPNPLSTLKHLAHSLQEGGTMRLMVYNTAARHWIHEVQRAFRLMNLNPFLKEDLRYARLLLNELGKISPAMRARLAEIGSSTFTIDARFVDTFFHAREARLSISSWYRAIEDAGLKLIGLFDRYAELDDLPNPLWSPPSLAELEVRANDRRFENNLELFLYKPVASKKFHQHHKKIPKNNLFATLPFRPPHLWFSFEETRQLPLPDRLRLWSAFLAVVKYGSQRPRPDYWQSLPLKTLQRLARVGGILPAQVESCPTLQKQLLAPMAESMTPPDELESSPLNESPLQQQISLILKEKNLPESNRVRCILRRLERAQLSTKT